MTWQDKKVAVLGFGREGQAMVEYLLKNGAKVTICDNNDEINKDEVNNKWPEKISWQLGDKYLDGLNDFFVIIRSPGIPFLTPQIQEAKKCGVLITSQTKVFFENSLAPIIGITGTKGKGTTATLIQKMLEAEDKTSYLVGNIGMPAISILDSLKSTDWIVYELSSFQLQDMQTSPQVAVVLGITLDHQDHHKTREEYYKAKENIVKFQEKDGVTIINIDYPQSQKLEDASGGKVLKVSMKQEVENGAYVKNGILFLAVGGQVEKVINKDELKLKGEFNLANAAAAVVVANCVEVGLENIKKVLQTFTGLPHHLEFVATKNGVAYWDNSYATTPETTIAAIKSFAEPIVLLIGGRDKGFDYEDLGEAIVSNNIKAIVGIGESAPDIYSLVEISAKKQNKIAPLFLDGGNSMKEMVSTASSVAKKGDAVLLSPAAASFDKFKNVTDRGEQFKKVVDSL